MPTHTSSSSGSGCLQRPPQATEAATTAAIPAAAESAAAERHAAGYGGQHLTTRNELPPFPGPDSYASLFLLCSCIGQLLITVVAASEFRQATYSVPGSGQCSTDEPYTVTKSNPRRCASQCLHLVNCADFNHKNDLNECALYMHKPLFYETSPGCVGFKASPFTCTQCLRRKLHPFILGAPKNNNPLGKCDI